MLQAIGPRTALVTVAVTCVLFAGPASAQQTRSNYERADSLRGRTRNKVFRDRVRAHWLKQDNCFWYQIDVGPGKHHFILVDATAGKRENAFDHHKLSKALSEATGKPTSADSLPIRLITYSEDGKSIQFLAFGTIWRCDLATYKLKSTHGADNASTETTVNILAAPRLAVRNGEETHILFVNRTAGTIKLYWVNNVASPMFYTNIEPGKQHEQHTFRGHVWLVADSNDKPLGVYEAVDSEGVAIIDGSWRPGQQSDRGKAEKQTGRRRGKPGKRSGPRNVSPDGLWTARIDHHNLVSEGSLVAAQLWSRPGRARRKPVCGCSGESVKMRIGVSKNAGDAAAYRSMSENL